MEIDVESRPVGEIEAVPGAVLHVYVRPGTKRPFLLGVTNDARTCRVELTALQFEQLLTMLDAVGREA